MKTSTSKTFQKGDDFFNVLDLMSYKTFDLDGGKLKHKYIVAIIKVTERQEKPLIDLTCDECGEAFKAVRSDTHHCSRKCYQRHYRRTHKDQIIYQRIKLMRAKKYALTQSPLYAPKIV